MYYAVREAQRAGRVEAVGPHHLRAIPRRLAAHLVPQTIARRTVASRRTEAGVMAQRCEDRVSCPNSHSGCTALRRPTVSRPRRCVIPTAARQRSRSGFSLCLPKRIPIATASHPNVGGAPYGRPFFAPVVPGAADRRPPAFPRQTLRIRVRGAIDLFISDGIRGPKRSTTA